VIFHMDGVLIDSGAHHRAAWRALLDELGIAPPEPEWWRLTIGRPVEEALPLLLARGLSPLETKRLAARKHDHYRTLGQEGPRAVSGARVFVADLAARSVPCAVATSASRFDTARLLGAIGLLPYFSVIVTAEDVRRGKPDPEIYTLAARGIALEPRSCVAFEDSVVGIQAARRASMRVIGVTSAYTEAELVATGAERAIASFEGLTWPP